MKIFVSTAESRTGDAIIEEILSSNLKNQCEVLFSCPPGFENKVLTEELGAKKIRK
jgi:hypothetical protein